MQPPPNQTSDLPTLTEWLALEPAAFKQRLDGLRQEGRGLSGKPKAQRAVQVAAEALAELHRSRK